uniref:non-specific serine/threonine protein kinase n=1 Tax=Vitrella brassicaformis TaxID=1169539 RepID=A0A7S1P410_9ALVE
MDQHTEDNDDALLLPPSEAPRERRSQTGPQKGSQTERPAECESPPRAKESRRPLSAKRSGGTAGHKGSQNDLKVSTSMFVGERSGKFTDFYRLGKKLGEGAYGSVWTAMQISTRRHVAVKMIVKSKLEEMEVEAGEKSTMLKEIDILKQLDHPNIMKVYEIFEDPENYFLVSELYTGGDLFEKLEDCEYLSELETGKIMFQLLSALNYCHKHHIMHRDIKPENILLASNAPDAPIKVIDFGTARTYSPNKKTTMAIGTPCYLAPEVLTGHYDERCDVWSAGVIMYTLLAGCPPFQGDDDFSILKKVAVGKFDMKGPRWKEISDDAKDLIVKLLQKKPDKRLTAKEALDHPFIQRHLEMIEASNPEMYRNFKQMESYRSILRVKTYIPHHVLEHCIPPHFLAEREMRRGSV